MYTKDAPLVSFHTLAYVKWPDFFRNEDKTSFDCKWLCRLSVLWEKAACTCLGEVLNLHCVPTRMRLRAPMSKKAPPSSTRQCRLGEHSMIWDKHQGGDSLVHAWPCPSTVYCRPARTALPWSLETLQKCRDPR